MFSGEGFGERPRGVLASEAPPGRRPHRADRPAGSQQRPFPGRAVVLAEVSVSRVAAPAVTSLGKSVLQREEWLTRPTAHGGPGNRSTAKRDFQ